MANLKPEEYLKLQYPNSPEYVLIRSVRIDSPKSTLKKDAQVFMWLLKVGKKEAVIMVFMTNSYEADLVTYKKADTNTWFIVLGYAMHYDMSKSEMENLLSDSKTQLDMLNKRLPHIQEGANVIRGVDGWVITQDPWDPNVVPKSLRTDETVKKAVTETPIAQADTSGKSGISGNSGTPEQNSLATKPSDPKSINGKFTLKVKSGPGVIIGITDVDIVDGKAEFEGIQFDEAGDYVVTVSSSSPDVDSAEIRIKVLPEPAAIPQESKGEPEPPVSGTRPIIAQIDPPILPLFPMEFDSLGSNESDKDMVMTSIGNLPFFNYSGSVINDRDIEQFRLYHEGMLPKVKIIFRDTNNIISENPPRDDTTFDIFIKSWSDNLKSIHMVFKVEDCQKMENNLYSITGTIDNSNLYRTKFKVYRGTSFNALREICKDLQLGFNSNIENSDDEMPWRNIGDRPYKFMGNIIEHSYVSEESFMGGYIDFYYCFNYVDLEKEMKRDISKDVGIDTGPMSDGKKKDTEKISKMVFLSDKGMQQSSFYFIKTGEKNESTRISIQQGYKTRTKFYDRVKKMFLVFDVDSTTSDESTGIILKGKANDKEAFDNNYTTKYAGKIDTDNVHKNYNYAVTQNRINLDNMMKNQMSVKLPNPNYNIYRYQKIYLYVVKEAATVGSNEAIEYRYSGEWLISEIAYEYSGGKLYQELKLVRKEMGKNPKEIRDKENQPDAKPETKDQKNENLLTEKPSDSIENKPNEAYKVGETYTVQDKDGNKYIVTIKNISENGTDVVAEVKSDSVAGSQESSGTSGLQESKIYGEFTFNVEEKFLFRGNAEFGTLETIGIGVVREEFEDIGEENLDEEYQEEEFVGEEILEFKAESLEMWMANILAADFELAALVDSEEDTSSESTKVKITTGDSSDFWALVAICACEDADDQGRADVAQSIYNRVASGLFGGRTIKGVVTANGQFEPAFNKKKRSQTHSTWKLISDKATAIDAVKYAKGYTDEQATYALKASFDAIYNSKNQKEAKEYVQQRTDFLGAGLGKSWFKGTGKWVSGKSSSVPKRRNAGSPNNIFGNVVGGGSYAWGKKNIVAEVPTELLHKFKF